MNGRTHVIYGIGLVFLVWVFIVLFWFKNQADQELFPSLLAFGVGGAFGALFPDFDLFFGVGAHRSTLTHSSLVPILVTFSYGFDDNVFARTLLMFICFGMATHLAFDLFISVMPKKLKGTNIIHRWGWRLFKFFQGEIGGAFKGNGADWANKHRRTYLIIHTFLCVACGVLLAFAIYNGWTIL